MVCIDIAGNLKTFSFLLRRGICWNVFVSIWKDFNPIMKLLKFKLIRDFWINKVAVERSCSKRIFGKVPKDTQQMCKVTLSRCNSILCKVVNRKHHVISAKCYAPVGA